MGPKSSYRPDLWPLLIQSTWAAAVGLGLDNRDLMTLPRVWRAPSYAARSSARRHLRRPPGPRHLCERSTPGYSTMWEFMPLGKALLAALSPPAGGSPWPRD